MLTGVCSGIAEFYGWSSEATRILFLIVTLLTGVFPGIILYTILGVIMPSPRSTGLDIEKIRRKNLNGDQIETFNGTRT